MQVQLGARIPVALKKKLDRFCAEHGLKMSHFVHMALLDKLGEMEEERRDLALAKERLQDAQFLPQRDYDRYLKRRLLRR